MERKIEYANLLVWSWGKHTHTHTNKTLQIVDIGGKCSKQVNNYKFFHLFTQLFNKYLHMVYYVE